MLASAMFAKHFVNYQGGMPHIPLNRGSNIWGMYGVICVMYPQFDILRLRKGR